MRLLILIAVFTLLFSHVFAESLSVTLQVGTTQVTFSGYTAPYSFVTIQEDSVVVGTTSSDGGGNFSQTITVAVPGLHTYELQSEDSDSRTSAAVSYDLSVAGNTTTSIDNIVMPPTIELAGDTLVGTAYPSSELTLTSSTGTTSSLTPTASGDWSFDLTTLTPGNHILTITATVMSYLSLQSLSISYTRSSDPVVPSSPPSPSSSSMVSSQPSSATPSPSPTTSSSLPFFVQLYDFDQNGYLSSSELFQIVKSWLQKLLVCDLNHDNKCNLIDLSILLYYIERHE